ncbi:biofilm regulation diguanylate cyclase SiaD [Telmatospirillum sp.]|uniref:biofilm regulation diguanylate cyclase SiaD n=1 Tax=Telmatospirillum sp. TaxID=2079197 RepID=UPI0028424EE4|nr:biofilm regulation diguanylate cyclase SiaD [Telmatospirillum sp.]MDR3439425.1 biofilm regulation diguanylate cyclase SiaD [Telmatospirillum sp.]
MSCDRRKLDDVIEELLKDPQYAEHPLYDALNRLWSQSRQQLERLERLTHISDGFQKMARDETTSLEQRYDRQLRKLERAARISDRYQEMMRDLNNALKDASTHDQLTGLANRRMLVERLKAETQRAERQSHSYSLAMLDVDHFKQINDRFGHDAGDRVLIDVTKTMQAGLREYDLCGRWGGEEFLILLPHTLATDAQVVIERIQDAIRQQTPPEGLPPLGITVSAGITEHQRGESFSDTVNRADEALLAAKQAGRNCCRVA